MALSMMDRVTAVTDDAIVTEKAVTLNEKFFQDHFPGYPVLPGVLMLEGLTQAAGWWIRHRTGFARSQARVLEVSSAKFNQLVKPSAVMRFECKCESQNGELYEFQGKASADGKPVMSARFKVESFSLAREKRFSHMEAKVLERQKALWNRVWVPAGVAK